MARSRRRRGRPDARRDRRPLVAAGRRRPPGARAPRHRLRRPLDHLGGRRSGREGGRGFSSLRAVENIEEGTVERLLREALLESGGGRPITERARQAQRSVDSYLKSGRPAALDGTAVGDRARDGATACDRAGVPSTRARSSPEAFAAAWRAFADSRDSTRQHADPPAQRVVPDRARPADGPQDGEYRRSSDGPTTGASSTPPGCSSSSPPRPGPPAPARPPRRRRSARSGRRLMPAGLEPRRAADALEQRDLGVRQVLLDGVDVHGRDDPVGGSPHHEHRHLAHPVQQRRGHRLLAVLVDHGARGVEERAARAGVAQALERAGDLDQRA